MREEFEKAASEWFDLPAAEYRLGESYRHPKLAAAWRWFQAGVAAKAIVRELAAGGEVRP